MSRVSPFAQLVERITRVGAEVDTITRLGNVTAIDATDLSLSVSMAGGVVTGVRWLASYTPTVGDFVAVTRTGQAWLCLGRLSRNLTGPGYLGATATIDPDNTGTAVTSNIDTPTWFWTTPSAYVLQGQATISADLGGGWSKSGGMWLWSTMATALPSGATVTSARLTMSRSNQTGGSGSSTNGGDLVSPVLYGHARTSVPASGNPSTYVVAGYGPWRPGTLARGQTGTWELPTSWLTGWMVGAIRGVAVVTEALADSARWDPPSGRLTVNYTTPA